MPHIHTEPGQYDQTVTAYIVRTDTAEPKALLHMHRKHGKLLPVGGHIELTETPWQAVAHELEEESGYLLNDLFILQPLHRLTTLSKVDFHPYPISMNTHDITEDHNHSDIEYAFTAVAPPALPVQETESADLRWLTQSEMNKVEPDLMFENTKEVYNFIFDVALRTWEEVPASQFST